MSVVIAIKKNGRVYMAADTQTSCGDRKVTHHSEGSRKITRFENGVLLAHTGLVHNWQILCAHPEYFTVPEEGELTKKYIVQNIIPKIFKCYRENDMCEKEKGEPDQLGEAYLLAYKDKLFQIDGAFNVAVLEHYADIGAGGDLTLAGLIELDAEEVCDSKTVEDRLVELLRISSHRIMSVSGPYYLIDTESQKIKMVQ